MPSLHSLNRILTMLLGAVMFFVSAGAVAAPRDTVDFPEPYKIPTTNPADIEAIHDVTGDALPGGEGEIHQELSERAVCGGWDMADTVNGKIPVVSGVPGRKGAPFGNILSGMAKRDETSGALGDGYLYPNTSQVKGWSTACTAGFPPYLDDGPPCKDDDDSNYATPGQCEKLCPRINAWQLPIWLRVWRLYDGAGNVIDQQYCVQQGKGEMGKNDDPFNGDCCERNGAGDDGPNCAGKYESDADDPHYDPYPGTLPPDAECFTYGASLEAAGYLLYSHMFLGWYYCCTGAVVRELNYDDCKLDDPAACVSHKDARRNCVRCEGDGLPVNHAYDQCMEDTSDAAYCTALHPPSNLGVCMTTADCPAPHTCLGSKPAEVFEIPCINDADCAAAGNSGICTASKCTKPAVGGNCFVKNGFPSLDENGEIVERGFDPMRQETGCRAGYEASITTNASGKKVMTPGEFVSYYREYPIAGYSRNAVDEAPNDVRIRQNIPVSCYGFYREFDTKNVITTVADARCVIAAYQAGTEFRQFYHTQLGHGSFGETSTYSDPDPTASTEIRDPDFESDKDLWYQNLGGGFSLLNGEAFEKQGQDMTFALLSLDTTLERARGPLMRSGGAATSASSGHGPDPYVSMRSPGALRRAFDDTVSNDRGPSRTITEWWQKQETEAQDLVHPAVAHIIVPSAWSVGLNLEHYFPSPSLPSSPPSTPAAPGSYDPRRMAIDVQTEVRDDLLGEVAAFLENALIAPVKERGVAIVVPFGSASDFRAYKEGWIRWKKMREDAGGTTPASVQQLINRLEEYAVQIDGARALRGEVAKSLTKALDRQGDAAQTIHDWLRANLDGFRSFQQERQLREQLVYRWRNIQASYRDFHDKTNMPWCKNDAFTTAIYSFLDTWLPGRPNLDGQGLPNLDIPRPEDLYIDLSALQTTQVPLLIPVLKPVQILVSHDELQPPFVFQENVTVPELPPLPPLPVFSSSGAAIPAYSADSGIVVTYPDVSIPPDAPGVLTQIEGIIGGMDAKYKQFWNAVTKPRCGTVEATKRCSGADPSAGDCCVLPGQEKYCRRGWNSDTCVHVEMDLVERFTRIGARPAVQLFEDFFALGAWRTPGNSSLEFPPCDPKDWACLQLHSTKVQPRHGWFTEANVRSQESAIDALRTRMFKETLQMMGSTSSHFPYQADSDTITPSFDVRDPVEISPTPGAASASASAGGSSAASSAASAASSSPWSL